jgi:hypothetical protein
VIRAKLVLLAAWGLTDTEIAARLDGTDRMVATWRRRFTIRRSGERQREELESRPLSGVKLRDALTPRIPPW